MYYRLFWMWCIAPSAHLLPGVLFVVIHCLSVDLSLSLLPSPSFFFSQLFVLVFSVAWFFINLATMTVCSSRKISESPLMIFWCLAAICLCQRDGKREVRDCAVCLCAAGLVCMKSSTSVVELVMLLCSQVGNLPPISLFTVLTRHNPCRESRPLFVSFLTHSESVGFFF